MDIPYASIYAPYIAHSASVCLLGQRRRRRQRQRQRRLRDMRRVKLAAQ